MIHDDENKENIDPEELNKFRQAYKRIKIFNQIADKTQQVKFKIYKTPKMRLKGKISEHLDFIDETKDKFAF